MGRPPVTPTRLEVQKLAADASPAAVRRLIELTKSKNETVSIAACVALLDRAYGKPPSQLKVEHDTTNRREEREKMQALVRAHPEVADWWLEQQARAALTVPKELPDGRVVNAEVVDVEAVPVEEPA